MPTGRLHARIDDDGEFHKCRCTLDNNHYESGEPESGNYDD